MSRQSAWGRVASLFWQSLTKAPVKNKKYVGEDHFGNKFYEFEGRGHNSNVKRGYDPGAKPEILPTLEWEAWLKGSRRFPPSDDEIALNRAKQQAQLQQDLQTEQRSPHVESKGRGAGDVDQQKQFPSYKEDDFESAPGSERQKK